MKTVAVFFGSKSAEHDVSIITALTSVIKPLELTKNYTVVPVYITKKGVMYSHPKLSDIALYSSGKIDAFLESLNPALLKFDGGLTLLTKKGLRLKEQKIDVAFPATHGTYGEDGALMGLLEMAGIPYVGCGLSASVLSMDKILAKLIAQANSIQTSPMLFFKKTDFEQSPAEALKQIKNWVKTQKITYPLFIKPAHLGSSIGITKVLKESDILSAFEVALHYDSLALIEQGVQNLIEVTLPIKGSSDDPIPALLEQPLLKDEEFFGFETKYMQGGKKSGKKMGAKHGAQGYSQVPAEIPKSLYDSAVETGLSVYKALGCDGIARVDMLIDSKTNKVYFNEINPLPGSLYAHNWRSNGVSGVALVEDLVQRAVERHESTKKQETTFKTNFLKQF